MEEAFINSWFTPTVLFIFINLMIATILFTSNKFQTQKPPNPTEPESEPSPFTIHHHQQKSMETAAIQYVFNHPFTHEQDLQLAPIRIENENPTEDDDLDSLEEARRPATVPERRSPAGGLADVDMEAKVDDFIQRFKQQLKLQRLDSFLRYKEMMEYSFKDMLQATTNFSQKNLIMEGALGKVYKGQMNLMNLVIQRLNFKYGPGHELETEISKLKSLQHKNIVKYWRFYNENNEKIIVYKAFNGTLNQHISDPTLTWTQRLHICLGVARALNHIHYDIIHCDINSSKVILDQHWEPKIYGFELSAEYPQSWMHHVRFSCYMDTNNLTPKYDVYCFGVLMLEVLCGRKPMITNDGVQEDLDKIIDPNLKKQMDTKSMTGFTNIAYKCLKQQLVERPTMDQIVKELEEVLELQRKHADLFVSKEHSIAADEGASSNSWKMELLEIPLSEIRRATNDFNENCFVGSGGYGQVYQAELNVLDIQSLSSMKGECKEVPKIRKTVAIKRISSGAHDQDKQGFLTEIELLTTCKHKNVVSLLGFCRENDELILVYEYASNGSLGDYLEQHSGKAVNLTWVQRIQICLDAAKGINYLHTDMEGKPRIIHRDIKSANILLDENLNAKIADFGLSKSHPANQHTIFTKTIVGTEAYVDPEYLTTGKYKKEMDIYSFGVVLFEVLSGRLAYDPSYVGEGLAPVARRRFNEGTLKELIDPKMTEEDSSNIFTLNRGPNQKSFHTFSKIAYRCLADTQAKRPTMEVIIKKLEKALALQGETMVLLRYRLTDILLATENFAETCCIGLDANGKVYKAELEQFSNTSLLATEGMRNDEPSKKLITVAIKHIANRKGKEGFFAELEMRAYKHPNIVSLLGFCDEGGEMIVVYKYSSNRSLDDYLKSGDNMDNFTWIHRLHMCLEIARGLDHLHTKMVNQSIIHNDIRSANILLDENREAKIGYFMISNLHPTNQETCMKVYEDPEKKSNTLRTKLYIYSFGVVLFEMFCGRVAYDPVFIKENEKGLAAIACQCFNDGTIERIMDPKLKKETDEDISTSHTRLNQDSLDTFLKVAYQCLGIADMRPTMGIVIKELEKAISQCFPETGEDIFTSNKESFDTVLNIAHQCLGESVGRPTMGIVMKELETTLK